jgi:hypothetical protein
MDGRSARPNSRRLARIVIGLLIGVLIAFLLLPVAFGILLLATGPAD